MIVIVVLLTIIAIDSLISIYEFFNKVKKQRYESIRNEILNAEENKFTKEEISHLSDNGNIDTVFWD